MAKNRAQQGSRLERIAIRILKSKGFVVHRVIRHVVRTNGRTISAGTDIFGCVDIIAKRVGEPTKWIQVTGARSISQKRRDLAAIPWTPVHDSVEIWHWHGTKNSRKDSLTGDALHQCYFQVYKLNEGYRKIESNQIFAPSKFLGS